jgi:serine O-acetyltransferase
VSPVRLWRLSAALRRRGHRRLALLVKKVNSVIYHNSLAPGASFHPDIRFGHHGFGTVIHSNVVIGRRVKIWQNVTIAVRAPTASPHQIVIEDDVSIGANAVIITPFEGSLHIGRGARIGAGAVVSQDVPAGATVVCAPARVIPSDAARRADARPRGENAAVLAADAAAPLSGQASDARLGQVEPGERAQEAVHDDHMDM